MFRSMNEDNKIIETHKYQITNNLMKTGTGRVWEWFFLVKRERDGNGSVFF